VNQIAEHEPSFRHLDKFQRVKLGDHKTKDLLALARLRQLSCQVEIVQQMNVEEKRQPSYRRALLTQNNPK
jgi:hypothetical protein